jgi:signal transduction histidine kinase
MGGYRSLKRVLGESNLERKCRWLFGVCVGGLILLAFWWVDWISEDLIDATAQSRGRGLTSIHLYELHWEHWTLQDVPDRRESLKEMIKELAQGPFQAKVLTLDRLPPPDPQPALAPPIVFEPETDAERSLLEKLKAQADALPPPPVAPPTPANASADGSPSLADFLKEAENIKLVASGVQSPRAGRYDYYQVVRWTNICVSCHQGLYAAYAESAASAAGRAADTSTMPFRVIRITMPYAETRAAINRTRAILLAVGILTVFLAMVALYYVVKYIVIKPLNHLRDVSEEVAQGDLEQRAEIKTNDEFEDLAVSFNKMLVHLVDMQGELREANRELDDKVDELAHLNMQLHEMNRLKGEFLATMSHELRTPLNSIIGFSEVLQSLDALNDKQKRYAATIHKSGRDLLEMINDILDLAKMEAGKMEVRLTEFRLDAVIHEQVDLVSTMAEDKNIDLRVEIEKDLPLLYQDQTKVQQILTNLLSNAIKFTPEGGRITVGAKSDPRGKIEFWVADTGVGIPAHEKEIIFEKFRQGKAALGRDNLTREYSGTGLGLSIVKELCKLLGGEVTVDSELGKGSTFRVTLPWMRTDTPAASAKLAAQLDSLSRPTAPPRRDSLTTDSLALSPSAGGS